MQDSIIIIVIALLTGMFKAMRDIFHSEQVWKVSIFKNNYTYWSWLGNTSRNKYKEGTNKERFLGSSTFLVAFTDGWHLSDLATIVGLFILGYMSSISSDLMVLSILGFFISFNIFYSYIFTSKFIDVKTWIVTILFLLIFGALGLQYIDNSLRYLLGLGLILITLFMLVLLIDAIRAIISYLFK